MGFNFPNTPTVGTVYPTTPPNYKWDGEKWIPNPIAGGSASNANPIMDSVAAPGTSINYTREDHVHPSDTSRAPLNSPTFTGDPKAPTPAPADNDTSVATTAFVQAALAGLSGYAPIASPTFTGDPKAPTPSAGDNDTSIATTAFVAASFGKKLRTRTLLLTVGSGTYNTPAGCVAIDVQCFGPGGGGGGGGTGAGTGGTGSGTTFGSSLLSAAGGSGNGGPGSGSVGGGTATGGDINISGQQGTASWGAGGASSVNQGVPGGTNARISYAGVGGWPGAPGSPGGYGCGGGSGAGPSSGSAGGGGAGGGWCQKLILNPAASYPYNVGSSPVGGSAGTSGSSGGNGGQGLIWIDEYY
jgi:hypothetical protein